MARYGRSPIVVLIANGIYGFEQFLLDRTYFNINSNTPARPYAVIGQWDLVKLANSMGVNSAIAVDTAAALDSELAAAMANPGLSLIVAQVAPRGLPTEME
jgi:indolepyruvate decarboxylase